MRCEDAWAVEVYVPLWTEKKGAGVWISKEKQTTHSETRKSKHAGNNFSLGHADTMEHGWKSNTGFARFLPFCHVRFLLRS